MAGWPHALAQDFLENILKKNSRKFNSPKCDPEAFFLPGWTPPLSGWLAGCLAGWLVRLHRGSPNLGGPRGAEGSWGVAFELFGKAGVGVRRKVKSEKSDRRGGRTF